MHTVLHIRTQIDIFTYTHLYTFAKILTQMHTGTHGMFECESLELPKNFENQ